MADDRVSVGVSFPARFGTVTAIWPFGVTVFGEAGLGVEVRPGAFSRLLRRFMGSSRDYPRLWEAPWKDLAVIDVGPRSALLRTEGSRGCRVVFVGRRQRQLLLDELAKREVDIRRVKTTFGWYVR